MLRSSWAAALTLLLGIALALMLASMRWRRQLPGALREAEVPEMDAMLLPQLIGRSAPFLVRGMTRTPPLERWRSEWGVTSVRVMLSPSGVFGAYGDCEARARLVLAGDEKRVEFGHEECARADPQCQPKHAVVSAPPEECKPLAARARSEGLHVYLRAQTGTRTLNEMRERLSLPTLARVSPYLSSEGCVTNLHWDTQAGVLSQTAGAKIVSLFSQESMPSACPSTSSPCYRRSYEDGEVCPPGARFVLRLQPGQALYIPGGWAHHIVSAGPLTLGAVWRLA